MVAIKDLSIENVHSVYSGKDGKCCCGCAGKHSRNTRFPRPEPKEAYRNNFNDKMVRKVIKIVQDNAGIAEHGDNHWSVVLGERLYIAYFDN